MFKHSLTRKLFGIFGALLMAFNSFAWGPWDKGAWLRTKFLPKAAPAPYKDPLLPFIHPESQVTQAQFRELLENLSPEQRKALWMAMKGSGKAPGRPISSQELEKELLRVSSHWLPLIFKKKLDYHKTVRWLAEKNDVHKAEIATASTFQLERRIMEKIFAKLWDKLSQEQKQKILEESGLSPSDAAGYATLSAAALVSSLGIASAAMGFTFYIIVAKTVVVVAAFFGVSAATTITAVAALCGPIGWVIAGVSAVAGALLIGGPNAMKTAAFVVALHAIKANAMQKSGIDISQYILK